MVPFSLRAGWLDTPVGVGSVGATGVLAVDNFGGEGIVGGDGSKSGEGGNVMKRLEQL